MRNVDLALVICNPGENRAKVVAMLRRCGVSPVCCSNFAEARRLLCQVEFRLILCRDTLSDGDFRTVLKKVNQTAVHVPVIVLSHLTDWDSYLKALGAGAFDYIPCPPDPAETKRIIWSALADTARLEETTHAVA
jgi:DNA-binding NtrC family response regulator